MHQAKHCKADTSSKMIAVLQLIVFTAALNTITKPTLICALQMRTFSSRESTQSSEEKAKHSCMRSGKTYTSTRMIAVL